MKKALNQNGKLINIIESISTDTYKCPICKEKLTRNFGIKTQFFSHPKGLGNGCELKMKLLEKNEAEEFSEDYLDILEKEYYNKKFDNIKINFSNYMSEDYFLLTQEQKNIIFSKEDRIKVSALAGSAKSSTLYYYCKERPYKNILYIVYNKAMKEEAEEIFSKLSHVDIKTIHGLAYSYVGKFYKNKLTFNYSVIDIIKDLNLDWNKDMELAVKIDRMMKEYMLSDVVNFEDLNMFNDDKGIPSKEKSYIVGKCKKLWELKKSYSNNVKVEHDFYLKLFHLSKCDLSNKYDIICLDESQDASYMVLDILYNSNVKGLVVVGDEFQAIYGWRKAVNIMPKFEAKEYHLTTSFRVSQNIANIANIIIKDVLNKDINMKGFNTKQTIVETIDKSKPYVCLCRTNSYIFAEVFDVIRLNRNSKLFFEGGYSSYNFQNIKDAWYFSLGHKTNNPTFNKFEDYKSMIEYAEKTEDLEILALDKMIRNYGSEIPKIVDSIKNNTINEKNKADVIFSTIHRSKGQTYSLPVYISNDHFDIEKAFKDEYIEDTNKQLRNMDINKSISSYFEEMAILYVAITRCAREIELSEKLKNYLVLRYKFYNNKDF